MERIGKGRWQIAASVSCFIFGLAFILNIQPVGDGMWFWYGRLFLEHQHLYADMHLPLQPLFVLLTAASQAAFGVGWLASKLLAVLQLALFCWGLTLVVARLRWPDTRAALLLTATFMLTLTASYFRFDDYHITGYIFLIFSILLLLALGKQQRSGALLGKCAALGIFSGLSLSNRLNDGAALLVAVAIILPFAARKVRLAALATFLVSAGASFLAIILLTGDTLQNWRLESLVRAAAVKGATSSVWKRPLRFFYYHATTTLFYKHQWIDTLLAVVFILLVVRLLVAPATRGQKLLMGGGLLVLGAYGLWQGTSEYMNPALAEYLMFALIAAIVYVLVRLAQQVGGRSAHAWSWQELLLAIPFLQILSGSVTSGLSLLEIYPAIAFTLLIAPFALPRLFTSNPGRIAFATLCGILAVSGLLAKSVHPYHWSNFEDRALFSDRVWYRHPAYGETYIEADQLQLMQNICDRIGAHPQSLLAITNPYPNWFCQIPPWGGYVQTWYDTTSRQTIETLDSQLLTAPPQWIVYQRSLNVLGGNEIAFGNGRPLAHRQLDALIVAKVESGRWSLVSQQPFEGANWMLVKTSPGAPAQPLPDVFIPPYQGSRAALWFRTTLHRLLKN